VLVIRLARIGAKKKPTYRVVVIEQDRARNGSYLEIVGQYNPRSKPATIKLDNDRIKHWVGKGAQPSPTVTRLIKNQPALAEAAPQPAA